MNDLIQFQADVELQAAAGDRKPTFHILAYDGAPMRCGGFGAVLVDLRGANVSGNIPILESHGETLDNLVGSGTAKIDGNTIVVAGTITTATPSGQKVLALARDGVALQASIGFAPDKRQHVRSGDSIVVNGASHVAPADGLTVIRSGSLREVSIVCVGAAGETQVSIAATANVSNSKGKYPMTFPEFIAARGFADESILTREMTLALRASYDAEHGNADDRVERIIGITARFPAAVTGSDRGKIIRAAAARGSITASGYEAGLLQIQNDFAAADRMVAERPAGPGVRSSSRDAAGADVMTAAFCRTAGLPNMEKQFSEQTLNTADKMFRGGLGIQELLLRAAAEGGYSDRSVIRSGNLREVLRAAVGTLSLPGILSNTANKFLLTGFMSVEQTWKDICKITPVGDFKPSTRYRLTDSLEYEELADGGKMKHGQLGEESYTVTAKTFAKMFTLTRKDIVNDDLGAFDSIRQRLGRGAGLKLNTEFWKVFLDNATFFSVAHGNLKTTAGSALAEDGVALAAAEMAFVDMRDALGHPLGVQPDRLLVPTALGVTARKIFVSAELRDGGSDVYLTSNINQGRFKPSVSSYIGASNTNGSDSAWYLLADPAVLACMEVAFLDGQQSPIVESADADFDELGIQFRGYHDFGCARAEWRGGVKSAGA